MKRIEYCPKCQDNVLVNKELIKSENGNEEICNCPKCGTKIGGNK